MTLNDAAALATAIGTIVLAFGAIIQLHFLSRQLTKLTEQIDLARSSDQTAAEGLAEQIRLTRDAEHRAAIRSQEWETLKACQRYDFDPVLEQATARIALTAGHLRDYSRLAKEDRDVVCLLNYLDGLATGIAQKLYIEDMVRDHLAPVFDHAVVNFIETGTIDRVGYAKLLALHARWFQPSSPTGYQSNTTPH